MQTMDRVGKKYVLLYLHLLQFKVSDSKVWIPHEKCVDCFLVFFASALACTTLCESESLQHRKYTLIFNLILILSLIFSLIKGQKDC